MSELIDAGMLMLEIDRRIEHYQKPQPDPHGINTAILMMFVELKDCVKSSTVCATENA